MDLHLDGHSTSRERRKIVGPGQSLTTESARREVVTDDEDYDVVVIDPGDTSNGGGITIDPEWEGEDDVINFHVPHNVSNPLDAPSVTFTTTIPPNDGRATTGKPITPESGGLPVDDPAQLANVLNNHFHFYANTIYVNGDPYWSYWDGLAPGSQQVAFPPAPCADKGTSTQILLMFWADYSIASGVGSSISTAAGANRYNQDWIIFECLSTPMKYMWSNGIGGWNPEPETTLEPDWYPSTSWSGLRNQVAASPPIPPGRMDPAVIWVHDLPPGEATFKITMSPCSAPDLSLLGTSITETDIGGNPNTSVRMSMYVSHYSQCELRDTIQEGSLLVGRH